MKITLIVEGKTEKVFVPYLRKYLESRLSGSMPLIRVHEYDGRIPKADALKRVVSRLLEDGRNETDHVIALTDVYTGSRPRDFEDAQDAIHKMSAWVGPESRFHAHAAQYDFEAWLLPYWPTIQKLAKHSKTAPSGNPESVNHDKSPAYHIQEIFRIGGTGKAYVKRRDADRILRENDLGIAISSCSQLKALVNTILEICGASIIP